MRLRRSKLDVPGISRKRRGKGFVYFFDGSRVTGEAELRRIKALVIPPAWTDVWISPDVAGHIQAVGVDAAGRKQYLYHEDWRTRRDGEKFAHMLEVARALPRLRKRLGDDLNTRGFTRQRVLAAAVTLLDSAAIRIGGEAYAQDDPVLGDTTFGLATLHRDHVSVRDSRIHFCFPAKGGITAESDVDNAAVAAVIKALLRRDDDNPELLAYKEGRQWRDVRGEHVNAYLREVSGIDLSAKDFRTWHGTVAVAVSLARQGCAEGTTKQRRAIAQAMRDAAELLGNTPAIARKSYADPQVLELYRRGVTIAPGSADPRQRAERAVLKLLLSRN